MNNDFSSLGLSRPVLDNLKNIGFTSMTVIQRESLPHILQNRDVIAKAKTGSGKTAAFGLGILHRLDVKNFRIQFLVLCPTRELADQVAQELRRLARFTQNIKIITICGGVPFGPQQSSLKSAAHIVVGTPGRVLKHLNKENLVLAGLQSLVLDEADRMLDMGFIEQIENIIAYVPKQRQTLLFSATFPADVKRLSGSIQNNAVTVETAHKEAKNEIAEYFYDVADLSKLAALLKILAYHKPKNVIIFCNTKQQTREIAQELREKRVDALAIHGDLEQYQRTDVMVRFTNQSCTVLVATDVAARGIDIKSLSMVINYDLPRGDESTYTHRIGRTGRAGEAGVSVTLFTSKQKTRDQVDKSGEKRKFDQVPKLKVKENFTLAAPNKTLSIKAGKKDKVSAGHILGTLTGDNGIAGDLVGKIDINPTHSYVAVESSKAKQAYAILKNNKIKGRKFPVWLLNK